MLQAPGRGTCRACYLSTWPGHWLFYYRSDFPKKSGGCDQHQNSWSEGSCSKRKLRIIFGGSPFKTLWPIFMTQFSICAKSQWEKLDSIFRLPFYFFNCFIASCFWAEPHLNMFVIWKNLLNGLVQNPPLDSAPVVLLSARHQAQSAPFVLCHQLLLLPGIIAFPWLDASIF